ncbi:MAG: serine acetyltransferase [Campylobacteraceae bacterium]|nr:serine acetyltransferase [Campylobacteraceae bacterium]
MKKDIQNRLKTISLSIIESYKTYKQISHLNSEDLPKREEVIDVVLRLREVLFPGYFSKHGCNSKSVNAMVDEEIDIIYKKLHKQVYCAFVLYADKENADKSKLLTSAEEKTLAFLGKISYMREILAMDVKAAYEGDPAASSTDEIIFSYPGIFAIMTHRIAHELHLLSVPLIPRIMSEYAHAITGIDIHPGAKIGKHFFIDHGTGIVIGETTQIGEYVRIYQGVTLGALSLRAGQSLRGTKRHPTLENNVIVYAGASILGGNTVIGEGVVIGSNVFITKSVAGKTNVSMKTPELQYIDKASKKSRKKDEDMMIDWVI